LGGITVTTTPETLIRPELPPAAWIIVEEPGRESVVLASTEDAAVEARAYLANVAP
jgi:hypothetical protein